MTFSFRVEKENPPTTDFATGGFCKISNLFELFGVRSTTMGFLFPLGSILSVPGFHQVWLYQTISSMPDETPFVKRETIKYHNERYVHGQAMDAIISYQAYPIFHEMQSPD